MTKTERKKIVNGLHEIKLMDKLCNIVKEELVFFSSYLNNLSRQSRITSNDTQVIIFFLNEVICFKLRQ